MPTRTPSSSSSARAGRTARIAAVSTLPWFACSGGPGVRRSSSTGTSTRSPACRIASAVRQRSRQLDGILRSPRGMCVSLMMAIRIVGVRALAVACPGPGWWTLGTLVRHPSMYPDRRTTVDTTVGPCVAKVYMDTLTGLPRRRAPNPHRPLHLLGLQALAAQRGGPVAARPQPVGEDAEEAPPDLRLDVPRALAQRAEHELEKRQMGRHEVGPQAALHLRAHDEPGDHRDHELPGAA